MENKSFLYDKYVSSGQSRYVASNKIISPYFLQTIKRYFPENTHARILDLGAGHGKFILACEVLGYKNITGVEISKEQIALAKEFGVDTIMESDIIEYLQSSPGCFDVVILFDILEHFNINDIIQIIKLSKNILSPNGKIIIHVPNAEGIFGMRIRYGDLTHETAFTPSSIKQLVNSVGLKILSMQEDKPLVHGVASFVRRVLWELLTIKYRLLLLSETGERKAILSQNFLIVTGAGNNNGE